MGYNFFGSTFFNDINSIQLFRIWFYLLYPEKSFWSAHLPLSQYLSITLSLSPSHVSEVMESPGWGVLSNHSHLLAEAFKALAAIQAPHMSMLLQPNKKRKKLGTHLFVKSSSFKRCNWPLAGSWSRSEVNEMYIFDIKCHHCLSLVAYTYYRPLGWPNQLILHNLGSLTHQDTES